MQKNEKDIIQETWRGVKKLGSLLGDSEDTRNLERSEETGKSTRRL